MTLTLLANSEGKRPLGIPGHGWEDNIKMSLKVGRCGLDASG
jgi:hypothetical protein